VIGVEQIRIVLNAHEVVVSGGCLQNNYKSDIKKGCKAQKDAAVDVQYFSESMGRIEERSIHAPGTLDHSCSSPTSISCATACEKND
jgi:hypothetical protein